jgi:hypothetical protein
MAEKQHDMSKLPILPISNLSKRHYGLSDELANCYLQAARVCLDRHHLSPQEFTLNTDSNEEKVKVEWDTTTKREKSAWANDTDATRDGAYACAIAATELSKGLYAISRAENRTGADYYVARKDYDGDDLEGCYRLEISGTDLDKAYLRTRLKRKISQTKNGESNLPALASVVGFRVRIILTETVEK